MYNFSLCIVLPKVNFRVTITWYVHFRQHFFGSFTDWWETSGFRSSRPRGPPQSPSSSRFILRTERRAPCWPGPPPIRLALTYCGFHLPGSVSQGMPLPRWSAICCRQSSGQKTRCVGPWLYCKTEVPHRGATLCQKNRVSLSYGWFLDYPKR